MYKVKMKSVWIGVALAIIIVTIIIVICIYATRTSSEIPTTTEQLYDEVTPTPNHTKDRKKPMKKKRGRAMTPTRDSKPRWACNCPR